MGNKANMTESAGSATSDVDDSQDPESTVVMDNVEPLQDDDATVVLGDASRVNVDREDE